jgi:hypothetical protein
MLNQRTNIIFPGKDHLFREKLVRTIIALWSKQSKKITIDYKQLIENGRNS